MRTTTLAIHIIAGGLGILLGFVALFAVKGATLHRASGKGFIYAMVTMTLFGAFMAAIWNVAPAANIPIASLTAYLVISGLVAVRPPAVESPRLDFGLMLVPIGASLTLLTFGLKVATSATGKYFGMPSYPFFMFAAIALLAVAGDVRMIRSGGVQALRGPPRLRRHLWRMSTALLIAAFSFFLGQAKVIPKPYRIVPLLMIPPLLVLVTMVYWLWRVRAKRASRGIVGVRAGALEGV